MKLLKLLMDQGGPADTSEGMFPEPTTSLMRTKICNTTTSHFPALYSVCEVLECRARLVSSISISVTNVVLGVIYV